MSNSKFDVQMRALEGATDITLDPRLPIVVRVDGKSFHSYYRHFNGHFSQKLQHAMNNAMTKTMTKTMKNVGDIVFGYTNSDEITFVLMPHGQGYYNFNGRLAKLTSIIASYVTAYFNQDTEFYDDDVEEVFEITGNIQISSNIMFLSEEEINSRQVDYEKVYSSIKAVSDRPDTVDYRAKQLVGIDLAKIIDDLESIQIFDATLDAECA